MVASRSRRQGSAMNGPAASAGPPATPLSARPGCVSLDRTDAVIDADTTNHLAIVRLLPLRAMSPFARMRLSGCHLKPHRNGQLAASELTRSWLVAHRTHKEQEA